MPKLEVMKHQFSTHFPQEEGEALTMSEDPAKDPHFKVNAYLYATLIWSKYVQSHLNPFTFQLRLNSQTIGSCSI